MRRWFDIYTDSSNSVWYYTREQAGENFAGEFYLGMPPKNQLLLWHNYSQQIYAKLARYDPGANPPTQCGSGELIPNPDQDYTVVQPWIRYDQLVFFTVIYPTANVSLFNFSVDKPLGDWADPSHQGLHVDRRRRRGDRLQPNG